MLPCRCCFLPTIDNATHPPPPSSACHNATTTMMAARLCPAQVSNTTPLPASSLTSTKGAMSQLAMWQPDNDATTVTCTTWHHDVTSTAMPPHIHTSLKDLPSPTNSPPPPHHAVAHEQTWTAPKQRLPPMPTNVNRCGQQRADTGNNMQTQATTHGHGQ